METTFLYILIDPRDGQIRYVGKSDEPFDRFRHHCKGMARTATGNWIRKLRGLGLKPQMDLLDEVPKTQWQFWEQEYIRVFRAINFSLLNLTDGGEGCDGYRHTEAHKQACRNKRHSEETKEKMRRFHSARTRNEKGQYL